MSDTPRTDAAAIRCACSTYVVPTEFAQQLEREVKEKWEALFEMGKNISQLERENAALKVQIRELIATMEEEGEMDAVRIAELKKENAALKKLIIEVGYIITYFNDEVALCRDPWHRPKEAQP